MDVLSYCQNERHATRVHIGLCHTTIFCHFTTTPWRGKGGSQSFQSAFRGGHRDPFQFRRACGIHLGQQGCQLRRENTREAHSCQIWWDCRSPWEQKSSVMDKLGNEGQGGGFLPSVLRPGGEEYTGRFSKKCCDRRRAVSASRFSTSFKDLSDAMVSPQDSFSPPDCHCLPMLSIRAFIWAGAMPKRVGRPNMIPS